MFVASHAGYARRLSPYPIDASLMVVYSDGEGVVPKVGCIQIKTSFPTIVMLVTTICEFALTKWYAASRSVFPIRIHFKFHMMRMAAIM